MSSSDVFSVIISVAVFAASLGDFLFFKKIIKENDGVPREFLSGNPLMKTAVTLFIGGWLIGVGIKNFSSSPLPELFQIFSGLSAGADGIFGLHIAIKYRRR